MILNGLKIMEQNLMMHGQNLMNMKNNKGGKHENNIKRLHKRCA